MEKIKGFKRYIIMIIALLTAMLTQLDGNEESIFEEPIVYTFEKDTIITDSFVADKIIVENCKVHFKGRYGVNNNGKAIDSINVGIIDVNEGGWVSIQSIDTKIKSDTINIYRGNFTVTTEAKDVDNGTTLKVGHIGIKYANSSNVFFQNTKDLHIGSFVADSSGYNRDGSDAKLTKWGVEILKWDNAYCDSIDLRKGYIGEFIVKNTNQSDSLYNTDGELLTYAKQQINFRAIWLDEGTNNVSFDNADMDCLLRISDCNTYCPPSIGNHHFKNLTLRGVKRFRQHVIMNSFIDSLNIIDKSPTRIDNTTVNVLKGKPTIVDSLSVIKEIL